MKTKFILILFFISSYLFSQHTHSHLSERKLTFPDLPNYKTIKTDLHQHTVFSDGKVWPNIRVMEALKDGLDAISLTEHLEYQPHKEDIPHANRNRAYEIAVKEAQNHDLIVISGSEITRRMPPGHSNAVFISDANKLLIEDSIEVFREAKRQGAFVFWNHPNWIAQQKSGNAALTDMHKLLIKEKLLDGIEVVNEHSYSDEAIQIALDNNLTMMGTSDIHELIDWEFEIHDGGHRPITLVFAKTKNADGVKDGLINKRTVVYYKNYLIGRDEFLIPLLIQSLKIIKAEYIGNSNVLELTLENISSSEITLQNKSNFNLHNKTDLIAVKPGEKQKIEVKTIDRKENINLDFIVLNAINKPNNHPTITLSTNIKISQGEK